jgi:glucan phosphoethanolaminetransferase (alkaline phosphatase superfamily)
MFPPGGYLPVSVKIYYQLKHFRPQSDSTGETCRHTHPYFWCWERALIYLFDSSVGQFTVDSSLMRLQLVLYTCNAVVVTKLTLKRVYAYVVCVCVCVSVGVRMFMYMCVGFGDYVHMCVFLGC